MSGNHLELSKSGAYEIKHEEHFIDPSSLPSQIDPIVHRKLVRKLDFYIVPMITVLYLVTFLDRANIGSAKTAGLVADLKMSNTQYNICLTVFFLTYGAIEIPANLALKYFGPQVWLPFLGICFGLVTMLTAFTKTFKDLVGVRMALGFAEGGVLPGIAYYLSKYYRRDELVLRIGLFISAAAAAGAFSGILSYGLLSLKHVGSVKTWRVIFLIEGVITIGVCIILLFILPGSPETARFLSAEERVLASSRVATATQKKLDEKPDRRLVLRGIFNVNAWIMAIGFGTANCSVQGLSLFLPTIVQSLGKYTVLQVQLRTVPPFIVAMVWSITITYLSSKTNKRAIYVVITSIVGIVGYAMLAAYKDPYIRYAATFFAAMGAFPCGALFISWASANNAPDTTRACAIATVTMVGGIGSVIASWSYLAPDAPYYKNAALINVGGMCISVACGVGGYLWNTWENKVRERGGRDGRLVGIGPEEIEKLGSRHPSFRYVV